MIIYLIISIAIFISLFYLDIFIVSILLFLFLIAYTILAKSIKKSLRRIIYILPYFLSVLILQSMVYGGEVYTVFGWSFNKSGIDDTIKYFIRIITVLYFLGIVFIVGKKIKIPNNKYFVEIVRVIVFFKIMRKKFFMNASKIRSKEYNYKQKLLLIKMLINNVYTDTFKNYPYNEYINKYYINTYGNKK